MLLKSLIRKLKKIFFYQKYIFFRKLRILLKIDQKILIKNYELILPPGHLLSLYNYLYPEYDEFISKLNRCLLNYLGKTYLIGLLIT